MNATIYQVLVYSKENPETILNTYSFDSLFDAICFLESKVTEGYDCRYSRKPPLINHHKPS